DPRRRQTRHRRLRRPLPPPAPLGPELPHTRRGPPDLGGWTTTTENRGLTCQLGQGAGHRPRRGHGRALGAVKHSILGACWHMLTTGELYRELGGDYFSRRDPERATRRLVAQLERLGHHVTLEAAAA